MKLGFDSMAVFGKGVLIINFTFDLGEGRKLICCSQKINHHVETSLKISVDVMNKISITFDLRK